MPENWLQALGPHQRLAGKQWALAVVPDRSHRVLETDQGAIIHDGRVQGWHADPLAWNGAFLALQDSTHGLRILTDRLGTVPVFWTRTGGGIAFASRLVDLLALQDMNPDPVGVLQMILLDQPLADRSLLDGVALLPPASDAVLGSGGLQRAERYWIPEVAPGSAAALTPWIDEGVTVLDAANRRAAASAAPGPVAWPVTGGFDSRCNIGVSRSRIQPEDVLFHVRDLGDVELPAARQLASHFGMPLQVFEAADSMRQAHCFDVAEDSGDLNVAHWSLLEAARLLNGTYGCQTMIDGFLQGILLNPAMFFREGPVDRVRDRQLKLARYRAEYLGMPADSRLLGRVMEASAADYPAARDGLSASQRYIMENRSRRMVHGLVRLNQNYLDVRTPGIDSELLDFVMRVPWELRKHARLYRRIIAAVDPTLAEIPHDKTGRPLLAPPPRRPGRRVIRRLRYYANRAWPGPPLFPGKETRFEYLARKDKAYRTELYTLLRSSEWLPHVLGNDPVRMLEHQRRRCGFITDCLGGMLNVALLEQYARAPREPAGAAVAAAGPAVISHA